MNRHTNSGHMFFTSVQSRRWTREHWWADATKLHSCQSTLTPNNIIHSTHLYDQERLASLMPSNQMLRDLIRKLNCLQWIKSKERRETTEIHFRTGSAALTFIRNNLTAPPTDSLTHFNRSQIHLSYSLLQSSVLLFMGKAHKNKQTSHFNIKAYFHHIRKNMLS